LIHIISFSLFIFLYTMCNQKYSNANVQVKQSINDTEDYNFISFITQISYDLFIVLNL